jgi:hypothetical protein
MKKIFYKLIVKFQNFQYVIILLLALAIIYSGIPGLSTGLAVGAGLAGCDPILIGASISLGGGIASTLSQYTGQLISTKKEPSKLAIFLKNQVEKNPNLVVPVLIIASVTAIPETYLLGTIGKDISKIKILVINLITRFLNFWLISWLGRDYLANILKKILKK